MQIWPCKFLAASSNEVASTGDAKPLPLLRVSDDDRGKRRGGDREDGAGEFWEELHEVLANVMLMLVIIHIAGVLLASVVHSENLTMAMITGRKRRD